MPTTAASARELFDREFLTLRAKVLEIAAALDRVSLAPGDLNDCANYEKLRDAIDVLQRAGDDRAEQVQLIFSRPYSTKWRQELDV
jgi:hypothetical protein